MDQLSKELKELLLKFPLFANLKKKRLYLSNLDRLGKRESKDLIKKLRQIIKERDRKLLALREKWENFMLREKKKILNLIRKRIEEQSNKKLKELRERLKEI